MFSMVYKAQEQAGSQPEYLKTINSYTPENGGVIRQTRSFSVRSIPFIEVTPINGLETLSVDVVETARDNLVIGQA